MSRRVCPICAKKLTASCDYCHSLNIRESHTVPGTFNCGNCRRRMLELKVESVRCHECELALRKEKQP